MTKAPGGAGAWWCRRGRPRDLTILGSAWRALETTGVEIIEGKFSFVKQWLPLQPEQLDAQGQVVTTFVKRPEEKGTDVALASHLILDAVDGVADSYAVLTNDSVLAPRSRC